VSIAHTIAGKPFICTLGSLCVFVHVVHRAASAEYDPHACRYPPMCVPKSRRLGFHHRPAGPNDYLGCVTRAQVHVLSLQRDSTRPVVRSLGWDLRNRDAIINEPSGAIIFASPTDWGGLRHPARGWARNETAVLPVHCLLQIFAHWLAWSSPIGILPSAEAFSFRGSSWHSAWDAISGPRQDGTLSVAHCWASLG
jgi:hypothetical protein